MTGPALEAGVGFSLRVPPNWFELDLDPATRDASIAELVRTRVAEIPELRERRRDIERMLRDQAAESWDSGAVYCAAMNEAVLDGVLPACVTVSYLPGPLNARSDAPDRIAALLPLLQPKAPDHPEGPDGTDGTWTRVATFTLPDVGPVVRTAGVEDVEIEPGRTMRAVLMQTFVPLPGINRVLVVSCSSPATAVAEGLLDLFEALTGTLRLFDGTGPASAA